MDISFLILVRLGIGKGISGPLPKSFDWKKIQAFASQQGLSAIVIDGIEKLPEYLRPPKELLLEWIGEVIQAYEYRYELYRRSIAEMASFYNAHCFKMMVLKGYACSLEWPKPEHRPCGDIDIWQFGKQKEADALLAKEKEIRIDTSEHHHTIFYWHDFMVENHYDFINIHHHKSNVHYEKILKELGKDDCHFVEVYGEKIYLPSPNLNALFLIKHLTKHFASSEITIRQLLDWAFFVSNHSEEVDWNSFEATIEKFGMKDLYGIFNSICVNDLGFEANCFHYTHSDPVMKERVLNDILHPEFYGDLPSNFIKRILYKFRRWRANKWKHELCYVDSMWSAFWSGIWSHLLKPSSI